MKQIVYTGDMLQKSEAKLSINLKLAVAFGCRQLPGICGKPVMLLY